MSVKALSPWFGSNRLLAPHVGAALEGCAWVGVPFMGGASELRYLTARTIVASDLHRHVINLALVTGSSALGPLFYRRARRQPFHVDTLAVAQARCREREDPLFPPWDGTPELEWALDYFVTCWMGRSNKAGIDDEFNGGLSVRWNATGGDSVVRYRGAVAALLDWRRIFARATFVCLDAFEFLESCQDHRGHGIYCDPPFPGPGDRYRFNCGKTPEEQRAWHTRLRDALLRFHETRVVCRFYDHPLVRELYPESRWTWNLLKGRTQANTEAPEVLLVNTPRATGDLFGVPA